jgi:hypothetical protein
MRSQAKAVQVIVAQRPEFKDYPGNHLPPESSISKAGGMHCVFD